MKQNRKPGIHLHRTAPRVTERGENINEYYWILIARNGKTIARSSETYKRKRSAVKSILIVAEHFEGNNHYYDHTLTEKGRPGIVVYKSK